MNGGTPRGLPPYAYRTNRRAEASKRRSAKWRISIREQAHSYGSPSRRILSRFVTYTVCAGSRWRAEGFRPETGTTELTIRLLRQDVEFAKSYAKAHGLTVTEVIDRYLRRMRALEEQEPSPELDFLTGLVPPDVDGENAVEPPHGLKRISAIMRGRGTSDPIRPSSASSGVNLYGIERPPRRASAVNSSWT